MARAAAHASVVIVMVIVSVIALSRAGASPSETDRPASGSAEAYYQFLLGKIRRFEGELGVAAEHLNRAASADDASAIRSELAETYLRMGEVERAVEQARLATTSDPSDIEARRTLVEAYMAAAFRGPDRKESTALAIDEIKSILKLSPSENSLRMTLARLLVQEERVPEALEELRALRASGGDPVATGLLTGRALLRENRSDDAEKELHGVLGTSPGNPDALLLLSQIAEAKEDWAAAAIYYARLVEARPSDSMMSTRLGYVLLRAGRTDNAITVLREASTRNAADRSARETLVRALHVAGRPGEALRELQLLLEYRPDAPALLIEAGRLHQSRGENDLALEAFRRAASAAEGGRSQDGQPMDEAVKPHLTLAIAALEIESGNPTAALRTLERLPRDGSELGIDSAALRVRALVAAGRGTDAVAEATAFQAMLPDDRRGPILLLEARLASGGAAGAEAALAELRPESRAPEEIAAAAELLRAAGRGRLAVGIVERALGSHPQDAPLHFVMGALHERLGNDRKAENHLQRAIDLDPKQGRALNHLGYSLADRGKDLIRAESLIRRAVALEPNNGAYADSLGWVLLKLDRIEEAEAALVRAADLMAGDGTVREHLGDLHMKKNDRQRALAEWKTALSLRPEDPERLRKKILEASRDDR